MNTFFADRLTTFALLLALLCSSACSGNKQETTAKADNKTSEPVAIEVATTPVVERNTRRGIEVVGSFEADDEVTISSQASGILDTVTVDVGTTVRKGQIIARLDQRELKLKVEQAEATLQQAEARLGLRRGEKFDPNRQPEVRQAKSAMERARYDWNAAQTLVENGDISKQQYDVYQRAFEQAEARYQTALENVRNLEAVLEEKRASLALSKKLLGDADILSPISGVVKEKLASTGEYLQPGKPVATIVKINPLRLHMEVPESFAGLIRSGMAVAVQVDAFADRELTGKIRRINPSLDEKNRSLIAEAEVANATGSLRPGMFARAQIVADAESIALMIPEKAVLSIAGVNKVFVMQDGRASERAVKLGRRDGTLIEIIEGVKVGERVITSHMEKLQDGSVVAAPAG